MALGPKLSAKAFTTVIKAAIGKGSDGVAKAMMHIGASGDYLKKGASLSEAKAIIKKLERSGAITNRGLAQRELGRKEAAANIIWRGRSNDIKEQRLQEYKNSVAADSVVREQAHSVTAVGTQHSVTAGGAMSGHAGIASGMSSGGSVSAPIHLQNFPAIPKEKPKPLLDVAID